MSDFITILGCQSPGATATKRFTALSDGTIRKQAYNAGLLFAYNSYPISSLDDLYKLLIELQNRPQLFAIRGKPKKAYEHPVTRRIHGKDASFEPCSHQWVMMDFDKIELGNSFDPDNPQDAVKQVKELLPAKFQESRCIYKFSASQNVPEKIGELAKEKRISVHLWFWCDGPRTDGFWKLYLDAHSCPADLAIYNPVQPHFTANPIFKNMADPLPERAGLL